MPTAMTVTRRLGLLWYSSQIIAHSLRDLLKPMTINSPDWTSRKITSSRSVIEVRLRCKPWWRTIFPRRANHPLRAAVKSHPMQTKRVLILQHRRPSRMCGQEWKSNKKGPLYKQRWIEVPRSYRRYTRRSLTLQLRAFQSPNDAFSCSTGVILKESIVKPSKW